VLITLVGLPGGGKSTIGRQLARRLGVDFVDSDGVIEARLGETIRSFFEREGEESFRDVEEAVIGALVESHCGVVATGGGAVLRPRNRDLLRHSSTVIYLRSTPEELFRRLRRDTQRPLLQVKDPLARLHELYAQRDPLYRAIAHFVIETGRPSIAAVVNMILMQLDLAGISGAGHLPSAGDSSASRS
jgi:shikimate kinase